MGAAEARARKKNIKKTGAGPFLIGSATLFTAFSYAGICCRDISFHWWLGIFTACFSVEL